MSDLIIVSIAVVRTAGKDSQAVLIVRINGAARFRSTIAMRSGTLRLVPAAISLIFYSIKLHSADKNVRSKILRPQCGTRQIETPDRRIP
jgi:hypothetical protein